MQVFEDRHPGGFYLPKRERESYPWGYWIGLSMWTGQALLFRKGDDFLSSVPGFRGSCWNAAKMYDVDMSSTTKGFKEDELLVWWFKKAEDGIRRPDYMDVDVDERPSEEELDLWPEPMRTTLREIHGYTS